MAMLPVHACPHATHAQPAFPVVSHSWFSVDASATPSPRHSQTNPALFFLFFGQTPSPRLPASACCACPGQQHVPAAASPPLPFLSCHHPGRTERAQGVAFWPLPLRRAIFRRLPLPKTHSIPAPFLPAQVQGGKGGRRPSPSHSQIVRCVRRGLAPHPQAWEAPRLPTTAGGAGFAGLPVAGWSLF